MPITEKYKDTFLQHLPHDHHSHYSRKNNKIIMNSETCKDLATAMFLINNLFQISYPVPYHELRSARLTKEAVTAIFRDIKHQQPNRHFSHPDFKPIQENFSNTLKSIDIHFRVPVKIIDLTESQKLTIRRMRDNNTTTYLHKHPTV